MARDDDDDDQVLTWFEWLKLNTLSEDTGRRLRASGQGPRFVRLSDRRIGVTRAENRRWLRSRMMETVA